MIAVTFNIISPATSLSLSLSLSLSYSLKLAVLSRFLSPSLSFSPYLSPYVYQLCLICGSTLNCQTLCLGARPRYNLVVDEDVKKPTNQTNKLFISISLLPPPPLSLSLSISSSSSSSFPSFPPFVFYILNHLKYTPVPSST